MKKIINYGSHNINKDDIRLVSKALKNSTITQGPYVENFERDLCTKFMSKFCTVVSSGSSALYLVGKILKWKKGDTIITTPISFLATSNCIELCNAKTKFIDIDKKTYTIDPNRVESYLKRTKIKIKALIGVDYAGHPCDWKSLRYLANKYRFTLINDGCHAMGSKINNNVGYACKYADLLTQSYHPVKSFTSGEGGAILSNNKKWDRELKIFRNNSMIKNEKKQMWKYDMYQPGFNFRLSDINCALGISQLSKLDKFIKLRRKIAKQYDKIFENKKNIVRPPVSSNIYHSYHLYPLLIDFDKLKINKEIFFKKMFKKGIKLQVHYIPLYIQPYYKKKYNLKPEDFVNSTEFYNKEVSIPIYPGLTKQQIKFISNSILSLTKV